MRVCYYKRNRTVRRTPPMNAPVHLTHPAFERSALAQKLRREIEGEVLFDVYSRGRYSTDASIYQIEPIGVVIPKTERDAQIALQIALEECIPVLPRGGGTSQCGQTVGAALVIDSSKHLNQIVSFDKDARTICAQPGLVLDALNAWLKPHGLWYPVDVSTSAQATLGGMAGNNSCGSRSIHYGNMVHNVRAIDAVLPDGAEFRFGDVPSDLRQFDAPRDYLDLIMKIRAIAAREAGEIAERYPKVLRRVGGYNLDSVSGAGHNMAHLLVGSEGTLAYSKRLYLNLSPLPKHKTLGICHFPTFYRAMEAPQHIVKLAPVAVELVDRTMIGLARSNPAFRPIVERCVKGDPDAILLVEFAGEDRHEQAEKLKRLVELMGDLGLPDGVVEVTDPALQRILGSAKRAQHHDVDERRRQTGVVYRGLRGAARALGLLHRQTHAGIREARHPGHVVQCVGRLPARAADTQHARRRRACVRSPKKPPDWCAIKRLFGRARRWPVRRMIAPMFGPRYARVRNQDHLRFERFDNQQNRAAVENGRPPLFRYKPATRCKNRYRARLVARSWLAAARRRFRRDRDVQQQRPLPQVRRRHHVSVVPRHRR